MFGSSQDRARQLAGRRRKERVSSSSSGYRSASSASQASQQSQPVSTVVHHIQPPSSTLKHPSLEPELSRQSQTVQHSLQAEHLSRVLYDKLTLHNSPPQSQFWSSTTRHGRYGSLGARSDTTHYSRNYTVPGLQQTAVSLQGGYDTVHNKLQLRTLGTEQSESINAVFTNLGISQYPSIPGFSWITQFSHRREYADPIPLNDDLRNFLKTLSTYDKTNFFHWFQLPLAFGKLERKRFYHSLSAKKQAAFRMIILSRVEELSVIEQVRAIDEDPVQRLWGPHSDISLDKLVEATERLTGAESWRLPFVTLETCDMRIRSTSMPDLRLHAYYSGGGGSTGSTTVKTTLNKLFDKYKEANAADADTVGVEGTMKYFQDTDVDVEGLESLAALEVVQAPTMGEMSREGFVNSWQEKNCETIDKQKAFIKNLKRELPGSRDLFTRVYKYTFTLAKTGGQKAVALEAAVAYWELLFSSPLSPVKWTSPNTPWLLWWTEFLNSSWKKSVNKDMWNETLKFAQLTLADEAMSFWNEESSWPSVIDDFVEWVKNEKRGGTQQDVMEEDY